VAKFLPKFCAAQSNLTSGGKIPSQVLRSSVKFDFRRQSFLLIFCAAQSNLTSGDKIPSQILRSSAKFCLMNTILSRFSSDQSEKLLFHQSGWRVLYRSEHHKPLLQSTTFAPAVAPPRSNIVKTGHCFGLPSAYSVLLLVLPSPGTSTLGHIL
jgi:hypothetical protein